MADPRPPAARAAVARALLLVGAAVVTAAPAHAQACAGAPLSLGNAAAAASAWPAPLDRRVALRAHEATVREALDLLALGGALRFSYSADLLPLDRCVRIAATTLTVGDALAALLDGVAVEPVVVGPDQVVLAPSRAPRRAAAAEVGDRAPRPTVLERVVVTGRAEAAPQRSSAVAVDVVSGAELARRGAGAMAQVLDASTPGVWAWTQSPTSLLARYGSIRGASSFGASYPKVYIDGVEVANPLLVTRLAPESIERVEVIRGPQGAALYGADAISGVVNIVTRQGAPGGGSEAVARTSAGVAQTSYAPHAAVAQDHALFWRGGTPARSASLGGQLATVGAYVPGGSADQLSLDGGLRATGARWTFASSARVYATRAGSPVAARDSVAERPNPDAVPGQGPGGDPYVVVASDAPAQRALQYTLATRTTFVPDGRWTHALVVGVDGYRVRGLADAGSLVAYADDSAARTADGGADRATLRLTSVGQLADRPDATATLTLAAEQSSLRERAAALPAGEQGGPGMWMRPGEQDRRYDDRGDGMQAATWTSSTGATAQLDGSLRRTLYVTGGVRLERDDALAAFGGARLAALPLLGVAVVRDVGPATLKLRSAYGKGIRSPRSTARETTVAGAREEAIMGTLRPEQQSGTELGADLIVGRALTLQVTRFDQLASDLLQRVVVADSRTGGRRLAYALQNVGQIANRGWELQGDWARGPLSLGGALSLVSSRVRRLAAGYGGDLLPGDRVLEVPARTASLTGAWTAPRWSASLTLAQAADWINYDRRALAADGASGPPLVGAALRDYWLQYGGVTRLRATLTRALRPGLDFSITGDNLLGTQLGEPDNATVLPGRTLSAGLQARF